MNKKCTSEQTQQLPGKMKKFNSLQSNALQTTLLKNKTEEPVGSKEPMAIVESSSSDSSFKLDSTSVGITILKQ